MGFRKPGMPSVCFDSLSLARPFPVEIKRGIDAQTKTRTWIKDILNKCSSFPSVHQLCGGKILSRTSEV